MKYGDNDDSTPQKLKHRAEAYKHVMNLKPLKSLINLNDSEKNA